MNQETFNTISQAFMTQVALTAGQAFVMDSFLSAFKHYSEDRKQMDEANE